MPDNERHDLPPRPPQGGRTGRGGQALRKRGITLADEVQEECEKFARATGGVLQDQVGMKFRHEFKLTGDGLRFTLEASRGDWPDLPPPFDKDGD